MKVSVIIVTYNAISWIARCIDSIKNSTLSADIIVVDNNSTDETVLFLNENYKNRIHLIKSFHNLGFGKGNNVGIKYALKKDYDYIFLQNQDAFLMPTTLEHLIAVSIENPDYGIISPIHLNGQGDGLEYFFGKYMDGEFTPGFYFDYITGSKLRKIYRTNFVNAAAWLIPVSVLHTVGGFDPIFWHYGEDNNYGQRVKFHGYKIGIVPECFIVHDSTMRMYENYLYSDRYYQDFVKSMQIKYADINIDIDSSAKRTERNILIFDTLINLSKFNFKRVKSNVKKMKMLPQIFNDINKSRFINIQKGLHYL